MAGEYYRWLARNEKPEEKRELTRKEKWDNWWDYHKWHVVLGTAAVLFVGNLIWSWITKVEPEPDYGVAYVGSGTLSDETVEALEQRFAELGQDLNGDGQVWVRVSQYRIYAADESEQDFYGSYAGVIQMMADFEDNTSFFFLLDDPVEFQTDYEALAYPDGTIPEPGTIDDGLWIACGQCPGLADLDLNGLYIARRIFVEGEEYLDGWEAMWELIVG